MKEQGRVSGLQVAAIIIGGVLVNIPLGVGYYYGNMSTYIDSSYIAREGKAGHTTGSLWIPTLWLSFLTIGVTASGAVSHQIGARLTLLTGMIFLNVAVYLSYFAIQSSFWTLHITLGILAGIGSGFCMAMSLLFATTWAQKRVGLCTSVVSSSLGGGSFIFNLALTFYINPTNLEPDINEVESRYFSQDEIINKVPSVFFVIGALTTGCHVIAFPLMRTHPNLPQFRKLKRSTSKSTLRDNSSSIKTDSTTTDNGHYGATEYVDMSTMNIVQHEKSSSIKDGTGLNSVSVTSKDLGSGVSFTPLQALRTRTFYLLGLSQAFLLVGFVVEGTTYKQFGILYISDDYFLTNVGVGINVAACVSRIVWGTLVDIIDVQTVLVCVSSVHAILAAFWYFTPPVSKWLFLVWTLVLQSSVSGSFIIYPLSALKLFGPKHYITVFGMMASFGVVSNCLVPILAEAVLQSLGWFWLFFILAVTSLIAQILNTCLPKFPHV